MRDRTSRAAKQLASIFLLVATLSSGLLPAKALQLPRVLLLDAVSFPAAPFHFAATRLAWALDFDVSGGPSRRDLENEIAGLKAQLVREDADLERARQELESYRQFMAVPRPDPFFVWNTPLLGFVRGRDSDVFSRSYIVSVGSRDGVADGLPVAWGNIALGRISLAGHFYSQVRILADPSSRVCVRFADSRIEGVLVGSGRQTCPVRYVPNRASGGAAGEIKVGEVAVTSGTDGVFPPGLVVGKVTRFARRPAEAEADVEVELWMDFSRVENCLVLKRLEAARGPV